MSTISQLESTVNLYKDMLFKVSTQSNHVRERQVEIDPALGRSADRRLRQILIEFMDNQITFLSEMAIKGKVLSAIQQITIPTSPKDIIIEKITKLRNKGIVICFGTKEIAEWLQSSEGKLVFTANLSSGAKSDHTNTFY